MLKLLAFDYGASSGRAIMGSFDGSKLRLNEIHRFTNDPVNIGGSLYWDVLRLFHEMKQGILKCVKNGDKDFSSIGIDTWGVDFGLLGSSDELLGNPFHYRDNRTDGMIDEACRIVPRREIYNRTGIQFLKFNTLYQLLAMKQKNSPLLEKAKTMLFMPDLLNFFLTGEKVSEFTITSTSQMYNPSIGDWDRDLIERMGLPVNILPDITDTGKIIGRVREEIINELNIGSIPVVAVAEHDTASAVISVPTVEKNFAYLSSGTWSLLGIESAVPIINDSTYNYNYTNEGGIYRTTRLLKNIMGLWIYQECKRQWDKTGKALSYDEMENLAGGSDAFISFINPDADIFMSPGNMPEKVATYLRETGQKVPEDNGSIVRCIMESLALKYRMAIEGLEQIVGYNIPVIHIVGGGSQNKMLCQFTANAIGKVVSAGPVEATAAGNLACQLIGLGEVNNLNEARELIKNSFQTMYYLPEDKEKWDEAYFKFIAHMKNL